jgi:hypothetical protein
VIKPHAYPACAKQAKSRQEAVISLVGRTICRFSRQNRPEHAGIYRPKNRPNRHMKWPKCVVTGKRGFLRGEGSTPAGRMRFSQSTGRKYVNKSFEYVTVRMLNEG